MEGLYRKVTRGYYSRINKTYSEDLTTVLKYLIKVKPKDRLNCSKKSIKFSSVIRYANNEEEDEIKI